MERHTPEAVVEERYDIVFEAAGAMPALELALSLVRKTGTLVQVGVHDTDATIAVHPFKVYEHELRIVGSNSLANRFSAAVEIMPDLVGKVPLLLGKPFSVWEFAAAVQSMTSSATIKTQLHFD
ncbi:zinc-binding dehydrogenase [Robbsia sp. KACC 23696]|uniref:zinc-binding dehydrogenase n=1 Tax=Robbsia sp. KACC 23696 TaxID=3149231 RepID=UPI00325AF85F